jgi:ABC-type molybdate transport system substrate-binding protein
MTDSTYSDRLREIAGLIGSSATREDVLSKAAQLKEDMRQDIAAAWLVVFALDNLVAVFAPNSEWQPGLWPEATTATTPPSRPPRYSRSDKTLELAKTLSNNGAKTVGTEDIAARLRAEGETGSIKDLATAVGNILTRSGYWQRLGPGEYGFIKEEADRRAG